jgi:hypothetical protein
MQGMNLPVRSAAQDHGPRTTERTNNQERRPTDLATAISQARLLAIGGKDRNPIAAKRSNPNLRADLDRDCAGAEG